MKDSLENWVILPGDSNKTSKIRPSVPIAQSGSMIHFENARRELELARTVDEVKAIRDKAEAMRLYCKQARHSLEMQNQCAEIKLRAERRAGEMLSETDRNQGGRTDQKLNPSSEEADKIPRLSDLGITRNQSSRWQKLGEIPEDSFEDYIQTTKTKEYELTTAGALNLARELDKQKKIRAAQSHIETPQPVPEPQYNVIVVDPPWRYYLRQGQTGRRNTTEYPTMSLEEIKAIEIPEIAADDSILWLWTTNAHLPDAINIVKEWGFEYKTLLTWVKNRIGTGHWLRGRTEHCIMAVKGHPVINLSNQSTVIHAPVRDHSQKPDEFYRLVETLCLGSKIELFARENRDGWDRWLSQTNVLQPYGF
jgi:N6-adenosine-specific RNA methylase IME4